MPTWLQEVFLGYGDPAGAHYSKLPNQPNLLDFRDTFLDWQHLVESFPGIVCFQVHSATRATHTDYCHRN